jgi:hypothetical protein
VQRLQLFLGLLLIPLLACGCKSGTDENGDTGSVDPSTVDQDADGYTADVDCDDSDGDTYPNAPELCDGVDNDCDGAVDESQFEMYLDADQDGYGDANSSVIECVLLDGFVENSGDCDDADPDIHPEGIEICDGLDNDCDASTTEEGLVLRTVGGVDSDASALFLGSVNSAVQVSLNGAEESYSFCEGTYYVNIDIGGVGVTLESRSGNAEDVIFDGLGQGTVVEVGGAGLDTSLFDLTIQNGEGEYHAGLESELAGGIGCFGYDGTFDDSFSTTANLTLGGLILKDNNASIGGGLFTMQCDVVITETVIRSNTGISFAGMYIGAGTADLSEVVVRDHTDIGQYAGVGLESGSSSPLLSSSFQDVRIENNSATYQSSGWALYVSGHDLTWTSTGAGKSTLLNNTSTGDGAAALRFSDNLTVQGVDFGEDGTANDNSDLDLYMGNPGSYYVAGNNASFDCTAGDACGNADQYLLGGYNRSGTSSSGFYGHVVYVDQRATVESFSVGLQNSNCTNNRALIFERNSVANGASQSWTVVWANYTSTPNSGFMESGSVGEVLAVGKYYAFVLGFDCGSASSGLHSHSSTASGSNVGIGSSVGSVTKAGTYSGLSVGSTLSMTYNAGSEIYETELAITEL